MPNNETVEVDNNTESLEAVHSENLGFREAISKTTSYNGEGNRKVTEEPTLLKNRDRLTYDRDTITISFADGNSKTIKVGEEYKPVINTDPWIANLPALTLISEDEDKVKISPDGVIIGVAATDSPVNVTAMSAPDSPRGMNSDPYVSATISITVEE